MSAVSSRSHARAILFATLIAVALLAVTAARSSAAYTITDFKLTPSPLPTPAGGHPNMHYHVDPDASTAGSDDLKKVVLDFPAGLLGNPEAASPKCVATGTGTANKFASDLCPSSSYIGSMLIKWREPLGNLTSAPGSVYVLSPATTGSVATIGFIVRPQGWRKIFLKTEVNGIVTVRAGSDADYGLTLAVDNIPRVLTSNGGLTYPITISDITVDINSRAGGTSTTTPNGNYFTFNPTRCDAATTRATINSYGSSTPIVKSTSYTPSNCAGVQFDPTASVTPTVTTPGAATGVSATFGISTADAPVQRSHVKSIQVDLPSGTGLNFPAIGAVPALCTDAQLNGDTCPAGSKIGTVSAAVPFLPPTMTGDVYLLTRNSSITYGYIPRGANGVKAPLKGSAMAVDIDGDGGADLVRAYAATMPQVPWTTASINFTSKLITNPTTACGSNTVKSTLNGWSGATAVRTNNWFGSVTCTPPVVAITSPANNSSTGSASTNVAFTVDGGATIPAGTTCLINGAGTTTPSTNSVALAVGTNTITVTCTNGAGSASSSVVVNRLIPAAVSITSPANNMNTTASSVNVSFTVDGATTIPVGTTCTLNATPVTSTTNSVNITMGANSITAACTNGGGTTASTITVNRGQAPVVTITSPANGTSTTSSTVLVSWTVTGTPPITCTVNGAAATSPTTISIPVGSFSITVVCTNQFGSDAKSVTSTGPSGPSVTITAPANNSNTTASTSSITWTTNGGAPMACTVNGSAATSPTTVNLATGANTITVTCSNAFGSDTKTVVVNRGLAPVVTITAPTNAGSTSSGTIAVAWTTTGTAPVTCTLNGSARVSPSTVNLSLGANSIIVVCTNAFGSDTNSVVFLRTATSFTPTFNQTLSSTAPGTGTDMHWSVTQPAGAEGIRRVRVAQDPSVAPNLPAYGTVSDMCSPVGATTTAFNVASCPPQSRIGTVSINATGYASPIVGYAYLIHVTPIPRIGIDVNASIPGNPSGVSFQMVVNNTLPQVDPLCDPATSPLGYCQVQIVMTIQDVPNIGVTGMTADFGGSVRTGSGGPLDPHPFAIDTMACDQATSLTTTALFTGWSAASATVADSDPLNCSALPPKITVTSPASGSWTTAASVTLQYTVDPGTGDTPVCTIASGTVIALNNGPNTISFSCTNSTGTASTSVQIGRDTHPPVITITSPANGVYTNLATAQNLIYTVTDDWDTSPQCTPAQGPISASGLNQGANVINVTCVDHAGNTSTASRVIYFDNIVPGLSANCTPQSGTSTTCTISVTEPSTLTCKVNNGPTSACTSPFTTNALLVDFANSITICATDQAGNSNCVIVTVGTPPPGFAVITQYAKPALAPGAAASVSFTPATAECRVDGGVFAACTSPWTVPTAGLSSQAEHTYDIRAVGQATTPARGFTWVDSRGYSATATVTPQANSLTTAAAVTNAGAHPDISAAISVTGSDDSRNVSVQFPDGLMGSLSSVPVASRCTSAQATAGTCPLSSQIGTISGTMEFANGGTTTATGTVYMVDSAGLPSQYAAGTAISLKNIPGGHGDLNVLGNLELVDASRAVRLTATDLPRQTSNNDAFHLLSGTVTIKGDTGGAASPLITNPHFCGPFNVNRKSPGSAAFGSFAAVAGATANNFFGRGTSWEGNTTPEIQVPYNVVNCAALPFNPTMSVAITNPAAGGTTPMNVNLTLPAESSTIRSTIVKLPPFISPNLPAFGNASTDQCSAGATTVGGSYIQSPSAFGTATLAYREFVSTTCPPQSIIGSAILSSPLLPQTLKADVYLSASAPIPALGIYVDPAKYGNLQGVRIGLYTLNSTPQVDLSCDPATSPTGDCPTQIQATLSSTPDVPVSSIALTLGGMTGRALGADAVSVAGAGDPACVNAGLPWNATLNSWSSTTAVARTGTLTPTGCSQ